MPPIDPSVDRTNDPRRWRILSVLLAAQFMTLIGMSIVNVILPTISSGIQATPEDLQWVLAGYALTFGVLLVPAGRAGDLIGRKRLLLIGIGIFCVASLAAGCAQDPTMLNIARFVQGAGSGILNPQIMGLMQQFFQGKQLGRAYGLFGTVAGVSVAIGPLLGGAFVALFGLEFGWRFTFWVNVPIGVITMVLAYLWIPKHMPNAKVSGEVRGDARVVRPARKSDFDPFGILLFVAAVTTLLVPFVLGRSIPNMWWLVLLSPVLVIVWVVWEQKYAGRGKSPMVDPGLFQIASFAQGNAVGGLYYLGITSLWVLVAVYAQEGQGFTALEAGFLGLPSALCAALGSYWAGRRVAELGRHIVRAGLVVAVFGLALSAGVIALHELIDVSLWWLLLSLSFVGVAQGMVISPNQSLTMSEVPADRAGSAGGMTQTFQRVGTALGIAAVTSVFYGALSVWGWNLAMMLSLGVIAVVVCATLAVSFAGTKR